jgi:hypothetical protein
MDPTDDKVNFRGKAPESNRPIRLGGSVLGHPCHVCAFFNNHDDEYRVLLPFIKDGLECGEKAVHTVALGPIRISAMANSIRTKRWLCSKGL